GVAGPLAAGESRPLTAVVVWTPRIPASIAGGISAASCMSAAWRIARPVTPMARGAGVEHDRRGGRADRPAGRGRVPRRSGGQPVGGDAGYRAAPGGDDVQTVARADRPAERTATGEPDRLAVGGPGRVRVEGDLGARRVLEGQLPLLPGPDVADEQQDAGVGR